MKLLYCCLPCALPIYHSKVVLVITKYYLYSMTCHCRQTTHSSKIAHRFITIKVSISVSTNILIGTVLQLFSYWQAVALEGHLHDTVLLFAE